MEEMSTINDTPNVYDFTACAEMADEISGNAVQSDYSVSILWLWSRIVLRFLCDGMADKIIDFFPKAGKTNYRRKALTQSGAEYKVAGRLNVTVSTLTTNVNGLEKKEYIRRGGAGGGETEEL